MNFDLKRPCSNCPFRTDKPQQEGWLGERSEEIIHGITTNQGTFTCHKTNASDDDGDTIETPKSQHCAGALIMLEHINQPNQLMRIAERFGGYDRTKLDMESPVFHDPEDFIEFHLGI